MKKTKQVKVDRDVWEDVRKILPNMSDPDRSRWLFHENFLGKVEKKLKKINNRGSLVDFFYLLMVFVGVACIVLTMFVILNKTNDQWQESGVIPAESKTVMNEATTRYGESFDGAFLLFFILGSVGVIALAALIRVHPVFIAGYMIALIFLIFFGAIGSNIYSGMADNPQMTAYASQLTFISHLMLYFPFILGILGTALGVVMYKSWSDG